MAAGGEGVNLPPGTRAHVAVFPLRVSRVTFTCMRGLVMLLRVSVIATPVLCRAERISPTEADGLACLKSANAPATWGAAIEVPVRLATLVLPGRAETMLVPGASKDRKDALFEPLFTTSVFVVLPTLMAEEMHAGWLHRHS